MNFTVYRYSYTLISDESNKWHKRHEISLGRLMNNLKREKCKASAVKIRNKKRVRDFFHTPCFTNHLQEQVFYGILDEHDVMVEELIAYDLMSRTVQHRIKDAVTKMNKASVLLTPEFLEDITGLPSSKLSNLLN